MASVFKRKRKVDGKTVEAKKYTVQYADAAGKPRRVTGYTDKARSWELAKKLEDGESDARHVQHRKTPLPEHVKAYRIHLGSERNTPAHVSQTIYRIEQSIAGCGWSRASDIDKTDLRNWLAEQRQASKISVQTSNYYQGACKAFCAWLLDANRLARNPLAGLKPIAADDDVRVSRAHSRRRPLQAFHPSCRQRSDVSETPRGRSRDAVLACGQHRFAGIGVRQPGRHKLQFRLSAANGHR